MNAVSKPTNILSQRVLKTVMALSLTAKDERPRNPGMLMIMTMAALAFLSMSCSASTVWNINIGSQDLTGYQGAATENPAAGSTWNTYTAGDFGSGPKTLADSAGDSSAGVTLTVTSDEAPKFAATAITTGDDIFIERVKGKSNLYDVTYTIANLDTGATYDLVIYADWGLAGTDPLEVTQTAGAGLAGTFYVNHGDDTAGGVNAVLTEDTDPLDVHDAALDSNYTRLSGLTTDGSGNLEITMLKANAPFNGFQLVEVGDSVLVSVPDVTGMSQTNAEAAVVAAGLAVGVVNAEYSETVPAGDVISQSPEGGTSIAEGSSVDLVLSLGPAPTTIIPDVVGMSQANAEAAVVAAGFTVGTITTEYSATVAAGDVISQSPLAAAPAPLGTPVNLLVSLGTQLPSENQPLKVFIVAGQSNMEGYGWISPVETPGTLEYIFADDPVTYAHLKDGANWAVRDDVWIWNERRGVGGGLSVAYGARSDTIGPELQFGHLMGDFYNGPVFILKTAWGGKSLAVDFRPPSSGWPHDPVVDGDEGYYYMLMVNAVNAFKSDPGSFCPAYDPADGYEFAGFGWHQGWNDRCNPAFSAEYEQNMKNFIDDVRAEVGVPDMPFCIATTGMDPQPTYTVVESAQLAMADTVTYPDFEGNVAVDDTRGYWRPAAESPNDKGYHWNCNAESYYLVGAGLGEAMKDLLVDADAPAVDAGGDKITWSGEPVPMAPTIVERTGTDWTSLTYKWTATPGTGVTISNDQIADPTVTIDKSTSNPSTVILKLEVNNSGRTGHGVINTMQIDVYDTACRAAVGMGLPADNPTDLDGNCITDFADVAEFARQWLSSNLPTAAIRR